MTMMDEELTSCSRIAPSASIIGRTQPQLIYNEIKTIYLRSQGINGDIISNDPAQDASIN
jgi:hypothetical protein